MAIERRGRPPHLKNARINMALSDKEAANLTKAAEIMHLSKAGVLREGLTRVVRHLKSRGEWEDAKD